MPLLQIYILYAFTIFFTLIFAYLNLKKFKVYTFNKKKKIYLAGGFFIFLNLIIYLIFNKIFFHETNFFFISLSICAFFLGLADDKFNLSPLLRIFTVAFLVLILLYNFSYYEVNFISLFNTIWVIKYPFSIFFTIICFLLILNAMNFADGINCLAISIFIYAFGYIFINFSNNSILIFTIITTLILLFYLNWKNFLYLGDSGVYLLSFLLSFIIIDTFKSNYEIFSAEKIFFLLYLPGIDLVRLFFIRLYNKKSPFVGDQMHIHHYLVRKIGSSKTLFIYLSFLIFPMILVDFFLINKIIVFLFSFIFYIILLFYAKN